MFKFNQPTYERFKFPFAGDVNQAINPWSWWSQYGLINVNLMASSKPELEKRIVEDVASYGSQLGRIMDVLCLLRRHLPSENWSLSDAEKKAMGQFDDLVRGINAVKAGYSAPTRENVESFIESLKYLKQHDVKAYQETMGKLERELGARE
ncbi:MAG TPA: hypothetical protein VM532_09950 [Burkholderiales bacterium]|nr:hypothetical protein [Burkholderiales bacterium]